MIPLLLLKTDKRQFIFNQHCHFMHSAVALD